MKDSVGAEPYCQQLGSERLGLNVRNAERFLKGSFFHSAQFRATLTGNLLYPLARTGPVVPSHASDDQEQAQLSGKSGSRTLSRALRS
jgi:hypothetical protein